MGFRTPIAAIAAVVLITGCDIGEEDDGVMTGPPGASEGGPPAGRPAAATTKTRCEVGGQPDYYVPKPEESPLAIIGCARLGLSMKPVEFSANGQRIGRKDYVCLNPAYRGPRRGGMYIPSACVRDPVSRRLRVVGDEVPSQGVRGYRLVIWGTAAPSTRRVVAHYEGERTETALFTVKRPLARATGAARPFSVFVVELDPKAACSVLLRAAGASGPSTTRLCPSG